MFSETRGLEYFLEILKVFHLYPGTHDAKVIVELMSKESLLTISPSYIQKILPRMVKLNLLASSGIGYRLVRPISDVTVSQLLDVCDMPDKNSQLYQFCSKLKQAVSTTNIAEFYCFTK